MSVAGAVPRRRLQTPTAGALVLSGSNALRMGVQLAMLPILARLVGPTEYGLVALAVPFVLFCNMLADGGMSQALARRQDASPELESTVFWLAGGLGTALAGLACLGSWPLSLVLDQPRLPMLILALSPILVMSGLTAAANARVIREGRFAIFAGGDLISTVASAAVAVWAALQGAGAWSLVAQQLTMWGVKFLWVNLNARPHITAGFRPSQVGELLRFGLHSIGSNLSDFVARNADSLIIGGVMGATAVGHYAMAYQIVRVPDLVISGPLYLYVFTAVAKAAHDGAEARAGDLAVSALRLTSALLAPVFAGLAVIAPLAVALVLGADWRASAPVLTNLTGAGFGFALCLVCGAILMALGRSHLQLRMAMASAALTITIVAVFASSGLEAVSRALGIAVPVVLAAYLLVLSRDLKVGLGRLVAAFVPAAVATGAMVAGLLAARPVLAGWHELTQLVALIGLGGAIYGGVMLLVGRRRLAEDARTFGKAHAGPALS